jgi:Tfp pilus assembly pilus retraction ATPase PilT
LRSCVSRVVHDIALAKAADSGHRTTGSGTTTLAAMIDLINSNRREKIISIEDPVEYLHTNKKAYFSSRSGPTRP